MFLQLFIFLRSLNTVMYCLDTLSSKQKKLAHLGKKSGIMVKNGPIFLGPILWSSFIIFQNSPYSSRNRSELYHILAHNGKVKTDSDSRGFVHLACISSEQIQIFRTQQIVSLLLTANNFSILSKNLVFLVFILARIEFCLPLLDNPAKCSIIASPQLGKPNH